MIIIMHIPYTTGAIQSLQAFISIHEYRLQCTWRIPLALLSPLADSPCSLFNPLSLTWNPPCCDRIRQPRSQVACKLTSPFSTLSPTLPPPNSQNPGNQRLTKMTLRIRHLLSGTLPSWGRHCLLRNPSQLHDPSSRFCKSSILLFTLTF
jgi:hypothetical protein